MELLLKRVNDDAPIPRYQTSGSAAIDLHAMIDRCTDTIMPGSPMLIGTGIAVAIPMGYVGVLSMRSGVAHKRGLHLSNGIGVIDSDYRGEIKLSLYSTEPTGTKIERGERIAQMMIIPAQACMITEVDTLPETARAEGGFGHTGK